MSDNLSPKRAAHEPPQPDKKQQEGEAEFEALRSRMFAIAYRMLGSAMDAEDVVQEAYLRFRAVSEPIRSAKAFLQTTVTRLCIDRLRAARVQREIYPGTWLPEPIPVASPSSSANVDPADRVSEYESLSTAFLLIMERLSPEERAAFLLHEVFDYDYAEIAAMLNKSEATCRQVLSRAKKHVIDNRPRFQSSPDEHRRLVAQFIEAAQSGEVNRLSALLAEGVRAVADGGGKMPSFRKPIYGPQPVAQVILGIVRYNIPLGATFEVMMLNGREAIIMRDKAGTLTDVVEFEVANGAIQAIFFLRNPEKLRYLAQPSRSVDE